MVSVSCLHRVLEEISQVLGGVGLMGAAHKAAPGRVGFTAEALWPSSS